MRQAWILRDFRIPPYPITFTAAFLASFLIVYLLMRRKGHPRHLIGYSLALVLVTCLYGARMYGVVISGFQKNILNAGTASLGGVIGLLLGVFLMGMIYPKGRRDLAEATVLVIPLMYGISKIGCFLAGCCQGIAYDGPLCVQYRKEALETGPVFPVQLLESLVFLLIFAAGIWLYQKREEDAVCAVIFLCGLLKGSLEYLRQEHVGKTVTVNQWICIGFMIAAALRFLRRKRMAKA